MDRSEYWIRFICAFLVFGALAAVSIFKWIGSFGPYGVIGLAVFLIGICHFTAKRGDDAWRTVLNWFHWW